MRKLRHRIKRVALSSISSDSLIVPHGRIEVATAIPAASRAVLDYYTRSSEILKHLATGLQGNRPCSDMLSLSLNVERQLEVLRSPEDCLVDGAPAPAVTRLLAASARLRALLWAFAAFIPDEDRRRAERPLAAIENALVKLRNCDSRREALERCFRSAKGDMERLGIQRLLDLTSSARAAELEAAKKKLKKARRQEMLSAQRKALDAIALRAQAPSANFSVLVTLAWERVLGATEDPMATPPRHEKTPGLSRRSREGTERLLRFLELLGPAGARAYTVALPVAEDLNHLMTQHRTYALLEKLAKRERKAAARRDRRGLHQGLGDALNGIEDRRLALLRQLEGRRGALNAVRPSHAL